MPNPHVLLACKEYQGEIYVSQLPVAIDDNTPGVPSQWYPVGPGLRPSVQKYLGNGATGTQFILEFEYLSHLTIRVLDIATWPPTVVDPVTFNPTSIQLPEDALSIKLLSTEACVSDQYFFNPVLLAAEPLFFDPITSEYFVLIEPAAGWIPLFTLTPAFYRVYRRPLAGGAWTLVQDWTAGPLSYIETHLDSLQFQYTATWGNGPDPSYPNVNNRYAEGIPGGFNATILVYDSENPATIVDYVVETEDDLTVALESTLSGLYADPSARFLVTFGDDAISISKSSLESSTLSAPCGSLGDQPIITVEDGSDYLIETANAVYITESSLSAAAGMF